MTDDSYYLNYIKSRAADLATYGAETEDLVQEGLLALYDALRTYDCTRKVPFGAYASACINNRMLSAVRTANAGKNNPLKDYNSIYDTDESVLPAVDDPSDIIVEREEYEKLLSDIRVTLSELEQKVLALRLAGYCYTDISAALGIGVKSVDNALARARRKLLSVQ